MNEYVGDIERHFEDIDKDFIKNPMLESLVQVNFAVYKSLIPKEL
ncbi:2OG-Fe dioxygenase family protein [Psychrobacter pygoscelis]